MSVKSVKSSWDLGSGFHRVFLMSPSPKLDWSEELSCTNCWFSGSFLCQNVGANMCKPTTARTYVNGLSLYLEIPRVFFPLFFFLGGNCKAFWSCTMVNSTCRQPFRNGWGLLVWATRSWNILQRSRRCTSRLQRRECRPKLIEVADGVRLDMQHDSHDLWVLIVFLVATLV